MMNNLITNKPSMTSLEIAELVGVHVIVVDDVLQRPDHVRRVEFVTVGEGHVGVERERVGQSVVGNLP